MFARALIVLLIAVNLGVALWWVLRPGTVAQPMVAPSPDVARLQLLSEAKPLATATAAPSAAKAAPATVKPHQCFSLGPFATTAALEKARKQLQPQVLNLRSRGAKAEASRGYTVLLPPFASHQLAQASAEKIKAAGFDDLLLINDGEDAHGIALGRYGSLESAQRRQAALKAAGFAAQLRPIGPPALPAWLDIETDAAIDIAQLRSASGAAQSSALDCARLQLGTSG